MKSRFFPLFAAPSVVKNKKAVFYTINEKVIVEAPGSLIHKLIELCDGSRSVSEVVDLLESEWDKNSVHELIKELCRRSVLVDRCHISDAVCRAVENPTHYPTLITDNDVAKLVKKASERHRQNPSDKMYKVQSGSLGELLNRRRSIRSFSDKSVPTEDIFNLVWSTYGEIGGDRRTVPSAGALYPLSIHLALLRQTGDFQPAVYQVYFGSPRSVGLNLVSEDIDCFVRSFADPLTLKNAHGVIVVSGSFHESGTKYGNRSMLYVPLEAGHSAQNALLAAVEHDVAAVEIGGFVEELLAETIKLPKGYRPLTSIVFGKEDKSVQTETSGKKPEVHWAVPLAGKYRLPFTMAFARMSSKINEDWSCGRAISPQLAYIKATSEAREWAACGCIPSALVQARFAELETAIDPREVIKFHQSQYRSKGFLFKPFSDEMEYAWIEGKDELRDREVHILADLVFFPYYPKTPPYAHANSSGVAAHPDRKQSIKNGVLELVERDSFMIAYLTKLVFPTVQRKTLPEAIRRRIYELERNGFKVLVKDYSLDLAPVMFVFAQNERLTFTTCAGCADFDTESALDHALMEVESSILCRLSNGSLKPITPSQVRFPSDHGRLYEQKQHYRKADFLAHGRQTVPLRGVGQTAARSWQELLDRFAERNWQLVTVPLHLSEDLGGNDGLHIIRSIVPGMVPISFGYREEPCGMERLYVMAKRFGGHSILYRDMPRFPPPYT